MANDHYVCEAEDQGDCELEGCPIHCEHSDCDEYCCLDCGKEMTEDWAVRAYDSYKDRDRE